MGECADPLPEEAVERGYLIFFFLVFLLRYKKKERKKAQNETRNNFVS